MRYKLYLLVFIIISILGCKSKRNVVTEANVKNEIKAADLNDEDQRRFDIFFYEANREKMLGNIEKATSYYSECLRIDPTSGATMFELANILISAKQYEKAQALLERAIMYNPNNKWYQFILADLYQNNGYGDKAIGIYEKLVKNDQSNEEYLYMLAQLYATNGKYREAIDTYNRLETLTGINEVLSLEKERIYVTIKDKKRAIKEVDQLINKFPNEAKYVGDKGDLYSFYKDFDDAKDSYLKALKIDSTYSVIYFSLSRMYILKNDSSSAKNYFIKGLKSKNVEFDTKLQQIVSVLIKKDQSSLLSNTELEAGLKELVSDYPYESRGYIAYGDYLKSENKLVEALDAFKAAVNIDNGNEKIWEEIVLLEVNLQDNNQLLSDGLKAINLFPDNSMFYLFYSGALIQLTKSEEAVAYLRAGLSLVDDKNTALKSQFHAILADALYDCNKVDSSFIEYDKAIVLNDKNIVALNNYSYYLSLQNKDLDKAERMSSRCIELEPGNSTYLDTYAWVLFKRGRYLEAKFIIERALDNDGDSNDTILEHYGDILYYNGDIEGAITQWKRALEIGKGSGLLKEKIENRKYIEE